MTKGDYIDRLIEAKNETEDTEWGRGARAALQMAIELAGLLRNPRRLKRRAVSLYEDEASLAYFALNQLKETHDVKQLKRKLKQRDL